MKHLMLPRIPTFVIAYELVVSASPHSEELHVPPERPMRW